MPNLRPKPEAQAEPKPEAKEKAATPSDLTPQIAKRSYELYEERDRAVQDWEQAEREIRKEIVDSVKAEPED